MGETGADGAGIDDGGARAGVRIAATHWSTDAIPPALRFATWVARPWPSLAPLFKIVALEPFETRSDHVVLGGIVLQYGEGTARRYHRSARRAGADKVDALGLSILLTGEIEGDAAGCAFRAGSRHIVLLDLSRPSKFTLGRSISIQAAVPRALAERHLGALDELHGLTVSPPQSMLLIRHLSAVRKALPVLTAEQGPLMAGVILDLLAIAIGRGGEAVATQIAAMASPSRIAAERVIEARLGDQQLSFEDVGAALQISRSSLYRLFEPDGGFKTYVQQRRLEQVRFALRDADNRDPIDALALRWGFKNAAALNRAFKAMFGTSPAAYRTIAR